MTGADSPPPTLLVTPNPSRGALLVVFSVPEPAPIELDLFDISGRHVARLSDGDYVAGAHRLAWDARAAGITPGIYFLRLRGPGGTTGTQHVTIIR